MILGISAFVFRIDAILFTRIHHNGEIDNCDETPSNDTNHFDDNYDYYTQTSKYLVSKNIVDNYFNNKDNSILSKFIKEQELFYNKLYKDYDFELKVKSLRFQKIPVDISMIIGNDELDTEALKEWRPEFKDAEFILENGKYIVEREVEKMSKSKYNVVNPDDICEEYGADCLRLYEMFLGPLEQSKPWNTQGLSGVYGFLKKFYNLYFDGDNINISDEEPTKEEYKILHTLIKKVVYDIEHFSFNTSVSSFMIAINDLQKLKCNKRAILEPLAIIISPYAPHICEELWQILGHSSSIEHVKFPELNEKYLIEDEIEYPVSFNGKMRFKISLPSNLTTPQIEEIIMKDERTLKQLEGKSVKKSIIIPKKIINIVF